MAMSRSAKEYTVRRLRTLAEEGCRKVLDCEEPCLGEFLRAAVIEGTAKLKPAKEILASLHKCVITGHARSLKLEASDLLQEPPTYKAAVAASESQRLKTEAQRQAIQDKAARLIDDINLDTFETGQAAIAQILAILS